ncbi:MAG: segregation/condensation protein A [Nanoarchaeota archaeon]|nr:segregation/condensation protein A [Nanoarchaeota archaeon]
MEYDELYRLILNDELGWEHLITYIVREEKMNPLDIDISLIADRFSDIVLRSKSLDFRFSGKFVYTAAILLKMKSDAIVDEILARKAKEEEESRSSYIKAIPSEIVVVPRLPINRRRPISLSELIQAVRTMIAIGRKPKMEFRLKLKEVRIQERMILLLERLNEMLKKADSVSFSSLLTKGDSQEIVYTFLSLLLLATQRKIDLFQEEPFQEITIKKHERPMEE